MIVPLRLLASSALILFMGAWFLAGAGSGNAADNKDLKGAIGKVADAMEKKDFHNAKKQAETIAKENELEDVMNLFKFRARTIEGQTRIDKRAMGIGPKPGAINPDGIEAQVITLAMNEPAQKELDDHSGDFARAAYVAAAVAEVASRKCPVEKKEKKKDPKDWQNWTENLRQASLELAEAAKAKKLAEVKKAAGKMNAICTSCHKVFRDDDE